MQTNEEVQRSKNFDDEKLLKKWQGSTKINRGVRNKILKVFV